MQRPNFPHPPNNANNRNWNRNRNQDQNQDQNQNQNQNRNRNRNRNQNPNQNWNQNHNNQRQNSIHNYNDNSQVAQAPTLNRNHNNQTKVQPNNNHKKLHFTFTILKNLSMQDSNAIMVRIAEKKGDFEELIRNENPPDFVVLIFRILAKICQADFTETVTSVLSNACSTDFLKNLERYLKQLPFQDDMEIAKNRLYHEDKDGFWSNLIEFFRKVYELLPNKARDELKPVLDKLDKIFKSIEVNLDYKINENVKKATQKLLTEITDEIKKIEESKKRAEAATNASMTERHMEEEDPPEDFRLLSTIPTQQDLINPNPFIRPCKIKDAYNSVEHYLDVQFRILREDFISPLRDGLEQYRNMKKGNRNDDVRVYTKVTLLTPAQNKNNVGIVISFGVKKFIKWRFSKRFMFGGLLLLSNDNFQNILFAIVADRNVEELEKGNLMIEPCEGTVFTRNMYNTEFVMLESKIYFEPYLAVLNAMKHMDQKNFPMQEYLVNGENYSQPPGYLTDRPIITFSTKSGTFRLPVREFERWPSAARLELDETQYDAFKCALTQEFAVIQGPPGTGKTFIALKIVSALLSNKESWLRYGPIIVVCLTNHALDQFLEGILEYTKSILRIGSRSKSEKLKPYTLMERRKTIHIPKRDKEANALLYQKKFELENILKSLHSARLSVQFFRTPDVIVPLVCLKRYCGDRILPNISNNDELLKWLTGINAAPSAAGKKLPQQMQNNPKFIQEECGEYDNGDMDDELELECDFEVNDSHVPYFPIKYIDATVEDINKQIIKYRQALPNNIPPLLDPTAELRHKVNVLTQQKINLNQMLAQHCILNPQQYPTRHPHWRKYWEWLRYSYDKALDEITNLEANFRQTRMELNEAKQLVDLEVLRRHEIIGLTTTGAAKLHASVRALRAPIVLVEEAAEILEAHVVCSLSQACQHVILIGDHKQLRPKASVYKLGTKYNLNISLFERMVNIRGDCTQLAYQHRMRPEIAKLLTPSIYEILYNHISVLNFPSVLGLKKNLFFLNHCNPESNHDNEESWVNEHESKFLIALARHLLMQGYDASEITILCTYTGQLFHLTKEIDRYASLKRVRVTTVDNYQGEENKIILLSLVRNNGQGNIGFLKEENRVCVALSRAREGMYIMGNMDDLRAKENIWSKIKKTLEEQNAIGDCLELQCQIHTKQLMQMKNAEDFEKCPEGGCLRKCDYDLACGHTCTSVCHVTDRKHKKYKCKQPCNKSCPNDHPCELICSQGCKPCTVKVERKLKCGHTVRMPCSSDPETFPCYIEIDVILPHCKHTITKQCHIPLEQCKCTYPCENRLPCGHVCDLKCHVTNDPDHIEYKCNRDCPKYNLSCKNKHLCKKLCFEECIPCPILVEKTRSCGHYYKQIPCSQNVEELKCKRKCNRKANCGHKCTLDCWEICGKCPEIVEKISTCGHIVKVKCCEEATASKCGSKCKKILNCGHPCTKTCKEVCTTMCKQMVRLNSAGLCGHIMSVPCYLGRADARSREILKYCQEPCRTQLECEHICGGKCGQCKQGRLHIPCVEACKRTLVCGHQCDGPCKKDCPPCQKLCELKCHHSNCNQKCGMPCTPCQEQCSWGCEHRKCKKRCNELCDIEPCSEPCKKMLKCNHPCVGFCGDPCPPLCRDCDKEELTEIFFGSEDEPDARFVLLEDCSHCIENEGLIGWLDQSKDSVQMKTCPKCKTPIKKCMRIMNQIKKDLQDVLRVKEKIFYDNIKKDLLLIRQKNYMQTLKNMLENPTTEAYAELYKVILNLMEYGKPVRRHKRQILNVQEIDAFRIIIDILNQILTILKSITKPTVNSYQIVKIQVTMLAESLPTELCITQQEILDFHLEVGRLSCMAEMCKVDAEKINDGLIRMDKYQYDAVTWKLQNIQRFTEKIEKEARSAIMKLRNSKEDIMRERQMIVKAVGLGQGHWFKCPNGHFYAIGECGGAMQKSKCPECGEQIGGEHHRLLGNNALASEMDGATRHAWPGGLH